MHTHKYPIQDGDAPFIPFTNRNFTENEAPHSWASCCPRRGCAALRRQEFYSDVLKSALLDRHILHVSKIVMTRWEGVCPHAADGAVAREVRGYQVTVY